MAITLGGGNMLTPAKRLIMMGYKPKNEVAYTPTTWAEWTKTGGFISADITGYVLSAADVAGGAIVMNTNLKPSTKYGLLYEVLENETATSFYTQFGSNHGGTGFKQTIGYQKVMATTPAILGQNLFKIGKNVTADGYIKFKDVRIFELPTNSEIDTDFTNLIEAQLNAKYPF